MFAVEYARSSLVARCVLTIFLNENSLPVFPPTDFSKTILLFSCPVLCSPDSTFENVTLPSTNSICASLYSCIRFCSCVTKITNFVLEISFKISITAVVFSLSRFPVGSSANMISAPFTNALAIATLCFCPPDRESVVLFLNLLNFTKSRTFSLLLFISCLSVKPAILI